MYKFLFSMILVVPALFNLNNRPALIPSDKSVDLSAISVIVVKEMGKEDVVVGKVKNVGGKTYSGQRTARLLKFTNSVNPLKRWKLMASDKIPDLKPNEEFIVKVPASDSAVVWRLVITPGDKFPANDIIGGKL